MAEINISAILAAAGYEKIKEPKMNLGLLDLEDPKTLVKRTGKTGSPYYKSSPIVYAEPYYLPVEIKYEGKSYHLPFPQVTLEAKKHLVQTPLTERTGQVMELVYTDAYKITVKGYMIGLDGEYPESDLDMLNELYRIQAAVDINNVITDVLLTTTKGKNNVVVSEWKLTDTKGVKNVREYELVLLSNEQFNLDDIS
ncbi:hypothetical protein GCM10023093_17040 [Nemorincola caseinilytica]|uniref:DUF6046 domain-containing protein n=1 Tax=Nemorincola caseinilytica TaxID=2054315 RepID=A0ABP8NEZ2_9BACT